jgi:hypothetical protein
MDRSNATTKFYPRNLKRRDHLGSQDMREKIILKWILIKQLYVCEQD